MQAPVADTQPDANLQTQTQTQAADSEECDSYTAHRLRHATPEHLHLTSRRYFIGPIPENWIKSNKSWYNRQLKGLAYHSRTATFSTNTNVSNTRATTGIEGPEASTKIVHSFPQPEDVAGEGEATVGSDEVVQRSKKTIGKGVEACASGPSPKVVFKDDVFTPRGSGTARYSKGSILAPVDSPLDSPLPGLYRNGDASNSTTSLIPHTQDSTSSSSSPDIPLKKQIDKDEALPKGHPRSSQSVSAGLVKFNLPEPVEKPSEETKAALISRHSFLKQRRHALLDPGEVVKVEKMLVRVDRTKHSLPNDYDENKSQKSETTLVQTWRELIVVCRKSLEDDDDVEFYLQMYKTRVISTKEGTRARRQHAYLIPLNRRTTKLNLFSSLDKTIVMWVPSKNGTTIYLLRPRSPASSVEWYTFLRNTLGWKASSSLQVHVPDLDISLRLENTFADLEKVSKIPDTGDLEAIKQTLAAEKAVAGSIIKDCMSILKRSPEWSTIVEQWDKHERMGLAWKRYDRLEWIHGANEHKMYGTLGMQKSHDLELRPKRHYPTSVPEKGGGLLEEPAPVEGFLVRLTSQKGREQRLGRKFSKRLYYSVHDHFLCYTKPSKAVPPPPPNLAKPNGSKTPKAKQIVSEIPLIYAITPFTLHDGRLAWLRDTDPEERKRHDLAALKEAERKVNTLLSAEGFINLCHVTQVRERSAEIISTGGDNDSSIPPAVSTQMKTSEQAKKARKIPKQNLDKSFELVLRNGLVVRFQAYDKDTRSEWVTRLSELVHYWKLRCAEDMKLYKTVRSANIDRFEIDEQKEAELLQKGTKWEVARSVASPVLFNVCGISCCRTITMSGMLYRKPKRHSTFERCGVLLCHGELLIFQGTLRTYSGKEIPHIQHDRYHSISLKDCYIYSGLITQDDLLYGNRAFDPQNPGHHALPRIYRDDDWTSSDEDTMTTFVIWHAKQKSFFRAPSSLDQFGAKTRQKLKYVSRLGAPGRPIVFQTRSRAERDHWVMNIGMEIERLQQNEDIRLVP